MSNSANNKGLHHPKCASDPGFHKERGGLEEQLNSLERKRFEDATDLLTFSPESELLTPDCSCFFVVCTVQVRIDRFFCTSASWGTLFDVPEKSPLYSIFYPPQGSVGPVADYADGLWAFLLVGCFPTTFLL